MKAENAKTAAQLIDALADLPKVRKRLGAKLRDGYQIALELAAAEMSGGEGQGSQAYLYVPPDVGRQIVDQAEIIIRKAIADLGVTLPE